MSRKLILPGEMNARSGLTILVPRGYESEDGPEPIAVCRVPTGHGETCGKAFFPPETLDDYRRHVGSCARQHETEIHEESPRTRLPIFTEEAWDPEVAAHMKKVGERMLAEGRFVVHKHERAGFSYGD